MSVTLNEMIARGAREHGPQIAVTFGDEALTFAEVDAISGRLANALRSLGAGTGERVALLLDNGLHSVPLDFACAKARLNRVPLNGRLSAGEHAAMLQQASCARLVYGPSQAARAEALGRVLTGLVLHSLDDGTANSLLALAEERDVEVDLHASPHDVVLTLFTSGTTGTLKAAQHTQASWGAICRNVLTNLVQPRPGDAMLHAASLIHASGVFVLPYWLRGGRSVVLPGFEPDGYLRTIEQEGITAINLVPTMLQMLLDHPRFAEADVSRLRQVIYGASPMPRPVIEQAVAAWGTERFWQYYGQTECPLTIAVLRPEHHEQGRFGACGQVSVDVELRLVNEAGEDVPAGQPGEIAVRGPSAMVGYHDADELNEETFLPGGWLRTRDIGTVDEKGFLTLLDRTSDMIVTGGYNVYPREVEDTLLAHSRVAECAVVGTPDDKWVEAVTAVVVLAPGGGGEPDEAALIAFVGERLAAYKKPRRIVMADVIPKTAVGKIDRKALRKSLSDEGTSPTS